MGICIRTSSNFNTQHVATRRNRVAKRTQHVVPSIEQCCDMLRRNVTIVWPELTNVGPTMLGYVVLIYCNRWPGRLLEKLGGLERVFAFYRSQY